MNRIMFKTIAIFTVALAMISCKKEETSTTTTPITNSTSPISYNDGADVSVDSANAVLYSTNPGTGPQREIDIYGYKNGKLVLEFHFLPKTGTQPVAQSLASAWLTYLTNNGAVYPSDYYHCKSGNFNLTTCDTIANKIVGTFDFIGNNETSDKSISSGKINITKIKRQ
jgi:hypothetical protein